MADDTTPSNSSHVKRSPTAETQKNQRPAPHGTRETGAPEAGSQDRIQRAKDLASQAFRNARKDLKPVNKDLAEKIIAAARQARASNVPFGINADANSKAAASHETAQSGTHNAATSSQARKKQNVSQQNLRNLRTDASRQMGQNPFRQHKQAPQQTELRALPSQLGGKLTAPPPKRIRIVLPLLIGVALAVVGFRISDMSGVGMSPTDLIDKLGSVAIAQQSQESTLQNDTDTSTSSPDNVPTSENTTENQAPTIEELNEKLSAFPPDRLEELRKKLESLEEDDETVGLFTEIPEKFQERVSERLREINNRERLLLERQILLETVEVRIEKKITELTNVRNDIQIQIDKMREEARLRYSNKILRLVKVYETMKPKQAASVFNTVDMKVLVPVAEKMKEAKLSAILAVMSNERATKLTAALAVSDESKVENLGKTAAASMSPDAG